MKTIKLDSLNLARTMLNNRDNVGGTDWDIYVNNAGDISCRHNTYYNNNWYEIVDLYSMWELDEFSPAELASYIEREFDLPQMEEEINDRDLFMEDEKISLEWE